MANTRSCKTDSTSTFTRQSWAKHVDAIAERNRYSRQLERYAFRGFDEDELLPDDEHALVFSEQHPAERLQRLRELRKAKGIERRRATMALKRRHQWNALITHTDHIRARAMGITLD